MGKIFNLFPTKIFATCDCSIFYPKWLIILLDFNIYFLYRNCTLQMGVRADHLKHYYPIHSLFFWGGEGAVGRGSGRGIVVFYLFTSETKLKLERPILKTVFRKKMRYFIITKIQVQSCGVISLHYLQLYRGKIESWKFMFCEQYTEFLFPKRHLKAK